MSLLTALILAAVAQFSAAAERPQAWFQCYNDAPDSMTCYGTLY